MNFKVKLGKLTLNSPVICASGTFGFGNELESLVDYEKLGAVIAKTVTLNPRYGNPPPRIYETECGVINSVGLENPGVKSFIKEKVPLVKNLPTKFIVSVGGFSLDEYQQCIRYLDREKRVDAFEINLSCPNLRSKKIISQDQRATYRVTRILKQATKKPLFIKITPEVSDIVKIAKAAEDAGADAVSLVNTFFALAINIDTKKPYLGNIYGGYSGKAIKPMALYRVWKVASSLNIPVIGGGGITNASDAIEFILAGAKAVSLGTINLILPNSAKGVSEGIKKYMVKNKVKDINKLRGGVIV